MQNNNFINLKNFILVLIFVIVGISFGLVYKYFEGPSLPAVESGDLNVIPSKEDDKQGEETVLPINETRSDCSDITDVISRDNCLIVLATETKNKSICDKISDQGYKDRCNSFPEFINN